MNQQTAYDMGVAARKNDHQVGTNPFDPASQPDEYEAWLDGWSSIV